MKETIKVKSPANIAFIKYWGQRDEKLILPFNDSFSMNLSHCFTTILLEKEEYRNIKRLYFKDYKSKEYKESGESLNKLIKFYDKVKKALGVKKDFGFKIYSTNSFPKKAGIASSASFFSAVAVAFAAVYSEKVTQRKLSILARLSGSGSACRSIPDGFSWWKTGKSSETSYAQSIADPSFWDLVDLVLILAREEKKVSSSEGHKKAQTSPFFKFRIHDVGRRSKEIKKAFFKKDFAKFGFLIEEETISMHSVMMTQKPPLYYWSGKTLEVIIKIINLRHHGLESYFTIDAGPNIHLICQKKDYLKIYDYFIKQPEVLEIIVSHPTIGARIIS